MLGDVILGEFPLHFLALEPDLLSLELEDSFEELYLVCSHNSVPSQTVQYFPYQLFLRFCSARTIHPYFTQPVH